MINANKTAQMEGKEKKNARGDSRWKGTNKKRAAFDLTDWTGEHFLLSFIVAHTWRATFVEFPRRLRNAVSSIPFPLGELLAECEKFHVGQLKTF